MWETAGELALMQPALPAWQRQTRRSLRSWMVVYLTATVKAYDLLQGMGMMVILPVRATAEV